MRPKISPDKFAEWLKNLSKEEIRKGNEQQLKQAEEDWKKFVAFFNKGICSICGKPLKTFSESTPCLHWLLRLNKFKKKHFPLLYERFTYMRIAAYVRWVASIEYPLKNINDIKEEHPGDKLIDFTARYKHITWSFSCGRSDYEGHPSSNEGNFPHYHFRMNLDGNVFIRYSDFHIPLHDDDLYDLALIDKHGDIVKQGFGRGAGMETLLGSKEGLEMIIDSSRLVEDEKDAAFHLQTIVMAPQGKTISGDIIAEVHAEAKASGKTWASIIRDKLPDASIVTTVSPGDGVPEAKQRSGRKKKKNR